MKLPIEQHELPDLPFDTLTQIVSEHRRSTTTMTRSLLDHGWTLPQVQHVEEKWPWTSIARAVAGERQRRGLPVVAEAAVPMPEKVRRLDPLSLPYLAQHAAEQADPVVALGNRIEELRAEMERAPEWKQETEWWTRRVDALADYETQLARQAPGHPLLPANVEHMNAAATRYEEPARGEVIQLPPRPVSASYLPPPENDRPAAIIL